MRKICYISGTRADFGIMKSTLQCINNDKKLDLRVIVTGMHLLKKYGNTWKEISASNLTIAGKVEVLLTGSEGHEMAIALGEQVIEFTKILKANNPDILLLLGDRGEMLAGAIAALHLNIPIVHIHGGELSGTIDDSIRHSISKLAHFHFTSTKKSRNRLIKMGEFPNNIFVTGAPGLDEIKNITLIERKLLLTKYQLLQTEPYLLFLFHPVVQQIESIEKQIEIIMKVLLKNDQQILILMPNSDSGSSLITNVIKKYQIQEKIQIITHAPRVDFLSLVSNAEVFVGNSSSGIIEAASLGTPVLNLGDRQKFRERNSNIIDVEISSHAIKKGLIKAQKMHDKSWKNCYGDGNSSSRIVKLLKNLPFDSYILEKVNAY